MSEESVLRPEFERWVEMTSKAIDKTATAIDDLKEYTIHNDHKHEETAKRLTNLGEEQSKIKEAVEANTRVNSFWITLKKYLLYVVVGGLTVFGGILANEYLQPKAESEIAE